MIKAKCVATFIDNNKCIREVLLLDKDGNTIRVPKEAVINHIVNFRLEVVNAGVRNKGTELFVLPNTGCLELSVDVTTDKALAVIKNNKQKASTDTKKASTDTKKANTDIKKANTDTKKVVQNKDKQIKAETTNKSYVKDKDTVNESKKDRGVRVQVPSKKEVTRSVSYDASEHSILEAFCNYAESIPPLDAKQNDELLKEYKRTGDPNIKTKIVEGNYKLVLKRISSYKNSQYDLEDLLQECIIAVMKAVDDFDIEKGNSFGTYAYPKMNGAITIYTRENNQIIRLPAYVEEALKKIRKFKNEYRLEHREEPSNEELAAGIGITLESLKKILKYEKMKIDSTNVIVGDSDGETEAGDLIAADQKSIESMYEANELKEKLAEVLSDYSDFDRDLLRLCLTGEITQHETSILLRSYFGNKEKYTREEIDTILSNTQSKISDIDTEIILRTKYGDALSRQGRHLRLTKLKNNLKSDKRILALATYIS